MSLPSELLVFLLAMAPISEVRGAIPTGLVLGLSFWKVFLISLLGNILSVFLLLLLLDPLTNFLNERSKKFRKFSKWLFSRTRKKINKKIEKYEEIGLLIFVAIPLPFTGGWTGAIGAFLLGFPFKLSFILVSTGIVIAAIIVSILSFSGVAIQRVFGWEVFFGIILVGLFLFFVYKILKRNKKEKK